MQSVFLGSVGKKRKDIKKVSGEMHASLADLKI